MSDARQDLLNHWRPILRALDPHRELGLGEIEALYAERPAAPYKELATDFTIAEQPSALKVILCGARGSGKSTELTRLAHEISAEFCVVHTDLAAGLPDQASTLAVVTLLGVASLHAIKSWQGSDDVVDHSAIRTGDRLQAALGKFGQAVPKVSQLLDGISGIVTVFDPATAAALATTSMGLKATDAAMNAGAELRHALARGPLEGRLKPEQRDDAKAIVDAVNEILTELEQLAGRPPLLLADGLDKRTGIDEVALALGEEYLLRELQAPMVLTGPVNLRHDPRFRAVPGNFRLALLYNTPVCERTKDGGVGTSELGIGMFRDLYQRRQSAANIPPDLIASDLLDRAALMSSGIVREFLTILTAACKYALREHRRDVAAEDLDAAIKARRLEMEGYLNEQHITILRRVLDKGVVPAGEEADTLLFENFVACYSNGHIWFRPHELIVQFVTAQAGLE